MLEISKDIGFRSYLSHNHPMISESFTLHFREKKTVIISRKMDKCMKMLITYKLMDLFLRNHEDTIYSFGFEI